jgi:predicted MFS family arabinose efflux permease
VNVLDGLRWLARHPLLRTLSGLAAMANLANTMALSTLVLFATQRLHLGPSGYGLLLGAMAAGGVLGSLLSRVTIERFGGRAVVTATILLTPTAQLAIAAVGRDPITVAALAGVCTACASLWNVATMSLRQRLVPAELRGRVGNAGLALAWGAQPVGAILGGLVAGTFGLAAPWLLAGVLRLATAFAALPALRRWPPRGSAAGNVSSGSADPGSADPSIVSPGGAASGTRRGAGAGRPG